jgi:probable selenium-dependent hydroxylase accessory protein YqeC
VYWKPSFTGLIVEFIWIQIKQPFLHPVRNNAPLLGFIERLVKTIPKKKGPTGFLSEALGLQTREMVSLVGAGGKTTLMFRLARELVQMDKRVVTTTTTKIMEPTLKETGSLLIDPDEGRIKDFVGRSLHRYRHVTVARERLESKKLKGISPTLVDELWDLKEIDTVIIEADGAAGRPVKAPREREPVIPSKTTLVVAILGVDGMGMELNEKNVFQPERISKMTGIPMGERITDESMALLMVHPEGIFKGAPSSSRVVAFLNKVDISDGVPKAKKIAQNILDKKHPQIERVVLGQLRNKTLVVEVVFP